MGFALDVSDIDLWNIHLLDTDLDLLDTDIPSKHFVCVQDVLKTSLPEQFFVFQDVSKTSSRRFQYTLWDVFKASSRRLGRRKIVMLKTCWWCLQEKSWRPKIICWAVCKMRDVWSYWTLKTLEWIYRWTKLVQCKYGWWQ